MRRVRAQQEPIAVDAYCDGPRRVLIAIAPIPELSLPDAVGAPMHVEFRASVGEDDFRITDRFQKPKNERAPSYKVWRAGSGSYCVRPGVSISLVGGAGQWAVEILRSIESSSEPGEFYLDRAVNTDESPSQIWIPPGHQKLHCVAGVLMVGGFVILPGNWVCTSLATRVGWSARGIIRTSCEV